MKIGNVVIDNNIALGPMAGVTDLPFRILCKEQGCGLLYTEMVSAKAILYNNKNTEELLRTLPEESPVAVQLFGNDPDIMTEIALRLEEKPFDIIDINMGCPVPKIVNNREGSALMLEPQTVEKILSKMSKALHKPLTIKIRKGFDDANINAVEIAKIAEACGVAAIAVHGRTRQQYYSGVADWDIIRQVKENVKIPVIGNGDITDGYTAKKMLDETGCDGIMIGRAARGNPWIFNQVSKYIINGEIVDRPAIEELKKMILRHSRMLLEMKGDYTGIREMRKHVSWYTAGYPHSAEIRRKVNMVESYEELEEVLGLLY
ncbi:MAG: tRNA dihydrouridine synthase DusB [Lachnospiraceae bacterium]|nr:tRNA dihydrouridine synthase DusB [Lachnospiraceae bacterium]